MTETRRYLLTTPEQCLTLNTFIKNLPHGQKVRSVNPYPGGYEVIVLTEEKPETETETEITLTAKNYNILRIRDYIDSGLGGCAYSN